MLRLFTAIEIPEEIKEQVGELHRGLPNVRWVPLENLHLTLSFIGDVDSELFHDIRESLGELELPSFSLALEGIGLFSHRGDSRVLWLGVRESEPLLELQGQVERVLRSLGIAQDKRSYKAHITLSRLQGVGANNLHTYLEQYADFKSDEFKAEHFTLFSSVLKPQGALHNIEEIYPLGDEGV